MDKNKIRAKQWREDNREYLRDYHSEYRKQNRVRMRELGRTSYHRNKYKRQMKQLTPDEVAAKIEADKMYREEHPL